MKNELITLFLSFLLAVSAFGSPARREVFLIEQPDGTSFKARLRGDEFCRILTTADGCAIRRDADGFYRYAFYDENGRTRSTGYAVGRYTPSLILGESRNIPYDKLRAMAAERRSYRSAQILEKRVRTRADTPESRHCLFIPVQFPDLQFQNPGTRKAEIEALINQQGYSVDGATGSMLDYFNSQFKGSYTFHFTVADIVTVSRNHDWYGDNDDKGNDIRASELVKEACLLSDPAVDFSQFDDDNDGRVDNVFVIVAGKSEAEGAGPDYFWPHHWYVQESLTLDGKRISSYSLSTELSVHGQNSSGQLLWGLCQIGTLCHEYSHSLGLEDVYDTDDEGSGGVAEALWFRTGLMDGGCYNNWGKTPPNYNALDRELAGIGRPDTLKVGSFSLEPIDVNGRYLIYENPLNRYDSYLFECRRASGWDTHIGGNGLLIYHMDMSNQPAGHSDAAGKEVSAIYRWLNNEVNCNPEHQCADLIETDPDAIDVSQAFYPFRTKTSFTTGTLPAFRFNDGSESLLSITNIQRSGDNVTFNVYYSTETIPSVEDLRGEVYQDAAILTWESDVQDYSDKAVVTWGETSKSRERVEVTPYAPGKYSLTLEGLTPTTPYSVSIEFMKGSVKGEALKYDFLTKALQAGKKPYIDFGYLSGVRVNGKFPVGTGLPLRVSNAVGTQVDWYFDGTPIRTDESGYYILKKAGALKAVVTRKDGSKDLIVKVITLN